MTRTQKELTAMLSAIMDTSWAAAIEFVIDYSRTGDSYVLEACIDVGLFDAHPDVSTKVTESLYARSMARLGILASKSGTNDDLDRFAGLAGKVVARYKDPTPAVNIRHPVVAAFACWVQANANAVLGRLLELDSEFVTLATLAITPFPNEVIFEKEIQAHTAVGDTLLSFAARIGSNDALKLLADHFKRAGIKPPNLTARSDNAPYYAACLNDNIEGLRLLAEHFGQSPGVLGYQSAVGGQYHFAPTLNLFHIALEHGLPRVASRIHSDQPAIYCLSDIEHAVIKNQAETVRYFVRNHMPDGPDSLVCGGLSLLMVAAEHGSTSCVGALIEEGARPDAKAQNGWTAFTFARRSKSTAKAQIEGLLLAANAAAAVERATLTARRRPAP